MWASVVSPNETCILKECGCDMCVLTYIGYPNYQPSSRLGHMVSLDYSENQTIPGTLSRSINVKKISMLKSQIQR